MYLAIADGDPARVVPGTGRVASWATSPRPGLAGRLHGRPHSPMRPGGPLWNGRGGKAGRKRERERERESRRHEKITGE